MSNLPLQSAVNHNDDNDEQTNASTAKLSTINSRITSPLIIKRQQNTETEIANNQAYDEIHDLQPKHFLSKRISNDNNFSKNSTQQQTNSNDLMQGNYYDRNRYDIGYSSSLNQQTESTPININVEEYKKTFAPFSTNKNSNNKNRTRSPPFGDTIESIQQGIVQSAGMLLERNKNPEYHNQHKVPTKNTNKSHEQAVIDYFPSSEDHNNDIKQRSLSPSSSECSTSDSSTSNKCQDDSNKSNIPYEKLLNDDDNDDELIGQSKKPLTESTTLLSKNHSQTYGTQSTSTTTNITYERGKCLPNNGYNSHGSSITTKSSSDNSGSIRTNSCTDNDEESDEEPYNNSTVSNNPLPMTLPRTNDTTIKSSNKSNDIQYSYLNDQTNYQSRQSNMTQLTNNNNHHLQVPRIKQMHPDDVNGNTNKLNSATEHNSILFSSKSPLQQQSINQSNLLSSSSSPSSHPNRNVTEHNPNASRTNSNLQGVRGNRKRKQPQQEIIRTESIPGHRGDRDLDELVMFIDGDSSRQPQNATSLRPTDTNKLRLSSKISSVNDTNSNKTSIRKRSRKNNNELKISTSSTTIEENSTSTDVVNQSTTNSITDRTNKSLELRNISSENHDEIRSNTVNVNSTNTTNSQMSLPNWYEQTQNTSSTADDIDSYSLSSTTTANNLNSDTIYEPFVTVTNRRRLPKERRQENNVQPRSTHFLPLSKPNDKRRIPSSIKNGLVRPAVFTNQSIHKPTIHSIPKEEVHNRNSIEPVRSVLSSAINEPSYSSTIVNSQTEQSIEKPQLSPRLSTHSSSSSLSSLLKRQTKPPPVVFLNKSNDIELNGVSFGFEIDSTTSDKSLDNNEVDKQLITTEVDKDVINQPVSPSNKLSQSNDMLNESMTQKSNKRFQQRNNRSPNFYSGSDIRPHQQRNYPSQSMPPSSYIDPLLLFQYNQRLANYPQQLAYMNLLRPPYVSPQSQYFFLPTTYATPPPATTATNEADSDDTINQTSSDQVQEPLLFYATPSGQFYFQPKKPTIDSEQQQPTVPPPHPTFYTPTQPMYPPHYFYPSHVQRLITPHTAYFQPIPSSTSSSLVIDTKLEPKNLDIDDDDYKNSSILYPQTRQQTSSDIMSNALQLVYSQQRRNAQTDRFNLDDLTAYLAMKWTDTVDHYEQGDNRIILVNDHT